MLHCLHSCKKIKDKHFGEKFSSSFNFLQLTIPLFCLFLRDVYYEVQLKQFKSHHHCKWHTMLETFLCTRFMLIFHCISLLSKYTKPYDVCTCEAWKDKWNFECMHMKITIAIWIYEKFLTHDDIYFYEYYYY